MVIRDNDFKRLWGRMKVGVGVLDGVEENKGYIPAEFLQGVLNEQLALNELMMKRIEQLEERLENQSRRGIR